MDIDKPVQILFAFDETEPVQSVSRRKYCARAIDNLLFIGTYLLDWERLDKSRAEIDHTAVYSLFRRIIEMLDACSLLIDKGSIIPCIGNLRIIVETVFQLEYLLIEPSKTANKGLHMMIIDLDREAEQLKKLVKNFPNHNRDQEMNLSISTIERMINDSMFDAIRPDYVAKAFKNGVRKSAEVKWYHLSSFQTKSENTIGGLASKILNRGREYGVFYSIASNVSHSSRVLNDSVYRSENKIIVRKIRDTNAVEEVTQALVHFMRLTYHIILVRRTQEQKREYIQAIQEFDRRYNFPLL